MPVVIPTHSHPVVDTDRPFVIDPISKQITAGSDNLTLAQHAKNSERFTFVVPDTAIEGHDLTACNSVMVHFWNVGQRPEERSVGIYEVTDLAINGETVTLSWLIGDEATRYAGGLIFSIHFACIADDGTLVYNFPTLAYSKITVGETVWNSETIAHEYPDILAAFNSRIAELETAQALSGGAVFYQERTEAKTGSSVAVTFNSQEELLQKFSAVPKERTMVISGSGQFFKVASVLSLKVTMICLGEIGSTNAVLYTPQTLTASQREQVMKNIGVEDYLIAELAKHGQLKPEFANSIKECIDTTKMYVLPDGYIYAYTLGGGYTNLVPTATDAAGAVYNGKGYLDNSYLYYSNFEATAQSGFTVTGFIPFTYTDVIRMSGVTWTATNKSCIVFYDANKKPLGSYIGNGYINPAGASYTSEEIMVNCLTDKSNQSVTTENGVTTFNLEFNEKDTTNTSGGASGRAGYHVKYMRISAQGSGSDMVVTLNEAIAGSGPAGYAWRNTGHAFVPADYEARILALEENMDNLDNAIQDALEEFSKTDNFDATEYGLPILRVTGNTASMTKEDAVTLDYVYGTLSGTCTMKWQGSSSIKWPKKNYTIKFDNPFEAYTGWGEQKKYCLKANYIDFSHARNLVNAKLWGQVVKSRSNANAKLDALVNAGAVDGFPISLFINDVYQGIYTFNIPKDGWMFGMKNGANEAIVCAGGPDDDTSAVKFRKADVRLDVDNEKADFDLEYVPDEDNYAWVKTSLDRMIAACINSNGTDLDTTVAQYLDWDSVIDYIIFTTLQNGFDGLFKNYLLATYDGVKWFFSAYDMDSTYGLYWDGTQFCKTNEPYNNRASIGEFCRLNRAMELVKLYKKDALKKRYAKLRADILSEDNVATEFANFMGGIPKALYDKECTIWKSLPSTATNNLAQITDFYRKKCAAIDAEIAAL